MRWLGRSGRRATGRHAAARTQPDPVAESALAPAAESVTLPDVADVEPAAPKRAVVRLGFADGTSLEIDDISGDSEALRATVERLLGPVDSE